MSEKSAVLITDTPTLNGYRVSIAKLIGISPAMLPTIPCSITRDSAGKAGLDIHTGVGLNRATAKWLGEFIGGRVVYFLLLNPNGRDLSGPSGKFFTSIETSAKKVTYLLTEDMPINLLTTFQGCEYKVLQHRTAEHPVAQWLYDSGSVPIQQPVFLQYKEGGKIITRLMIQRAEGHYQPLNSPRNSYIARADIVAWAPVCTPDNLFYDYA